MTEAETLAAALDRRVPNLDGVPTIVQAATLLRQQAAEIERLRMALEIARQFMVIASDWNIDEAEINGEMRSTYDWIEVVDAALENKHD